MKAGISCIERAFQLAKSGQYVNVTAIKSQLNKEGYDAYQIFGPNLCKQIRATINLSRPGPQ
jgi:hypothetical protein